jgi:hypothetical protein
MNKVYWEVGSQLRLVPRQAAYASPKDCLLACSVCSIALSYLCQVFYIEPEVDGRRGQRGAQRYEENSGLRNKKTASDRVLSRKYDIHLTAKGIPCPLWITNVHYGAVEDPPLNPIIREK